MLKRRSTSCEIAVKKENFEASQDRRKIFFINQKQVDHQMIIAKVYVTE